MAGTFNKNARPKRPGSYFNFVVQQQEPALRNTLGTVVLAARHSWGPANEVVEVNSWAQWLGIFGRSNDPSVFTDGYRAAYDCFRGEGVDGRGGAGTVLFYRIAGDSAAPAEAIVDAKITLTALYPGAYGEQISYTVEADGTDTATHDNLVIYVEGVEVERYKYEADEVEDLAAQINGEAPYSALTRSNWVTASDATDGTAITEALAQVPLAGGDDGLTLIAADYTKFMAAVEPQRFSLMAFDDITDETLLTTLSVWATGLNESGKRFMLVVGGAAGESLNDAVSGGGTPATAGSSAFNSPDVVRLGIGTYTDDRFGDSSTAQLAPRVAGILAWRGEALGLTYARLAGLQVKVGAKVKDIEKAMDSGVTTLARDSHPVAPVRLDSAVTTYTDQTNPARPVSVFGNPKFVRTMHGLESELTEFAEAEIIGLVPVNDGTRNYVRGQMSARLQVRENAGVIQPGWEVNISTEPPPSDDDNFVSLDYAVRFARELTQVLNTVVVG